MFSVNAGSKEQRRESIRHAANPVFMGSTVRANDRFAIKAIISKHPAKFRSVLEIYGDDMVVQIIASLLDNGTFAKTNPRLESTQTHQPSEVRDRQHDALEQKAAQSETKALDEALRSDLALHEGNEGGEQIDVTEAGPIEDSDGSISSNSPSLFPSYLTYASQHKLLNTVQRVLEDCCYDWVAKWIPFLLEERRWTCSEAVELGKWTAIIPQRFHTFSFDATSLDSGEALTAVFLATHPLRHAAVHRLRTSVKGIERMLKNALNLATALQDKQRKCKLHDILMDFRATVQVMELNKNELENQLDEELRNIQEQRVALDKKEKEARLGMFQQDRENTTQISYQFENSIRNLTSMDESSATVVGLDKLRNPDSEEGRGDAVAGGAPGKHGVEGIHHTTGEASKPSKHGDSEFSATEAILDNNSAGDNQIATLEDTDSKSSIREDSEASTADSTGVPVQQIESDSAALLSELQPVD